MTSQKTVKPSRSLLTRLIVGGTTLVVGVAAYFSYQVVRNATLENLKENAFLKVSRGADEIDKWIALRKSETEAIASIPITRTMNWTTITPHFEAEYQRLKSFEPLLGIIDSEGEFFNLLKGRTNINLKDRLHFKRGMAGEPTVMDPMLSRVNRRHIIVFAAPIWSGPPQAASRQPIGVVNAPVGIEKITNVVGDLKYGNGSYAFALNSKGEAIVHPNSALMSTLEKPAPSLIKSNDSALAMISQRMVDRKTGIERVTLDGVDKYVAFLPLKEANWSVALVIPRENIEVQLRLLDGIAFVVLMLTGTLIGVLAYVQSSEQAQLKKSKLAADAANQAKSEFLSNMSHELRTPLNGILGYAQILTRSKTWGEKEQRGIQIIHQCGSHLLTLINDILDLSKIEARKLELHPAPVYLPAFLQSVVEICRIRAEQKHLEFIYAPDASLPAAVYADEKRLRQVLINLLGNATKFTDKGSVIFKVEVLDHPVSTPASDPLAAHLRFTIADTGVGIAPDQIEAIFKPFEQVGDRTRQSEGTGLGLAISSQIVALMGGEIQLKSQPGVGSDFSFEVRLPLATDWVRDSSTESGRVLVGYEGDRRTILIVDDRWENCSVLVSLLEPLGFNLVEAENGQVGLEKAAAQPDLIITDLAMPVMDGFEMLKTLRQDDQLRHLKVIVSSASVSDMDRQESIEAGGDDFLAKPVQADELFQQLQQHLNLTWIYQTQEVAPSTPEMAIAPALTRESAGIPDRDTLQVFLEMAQQGRLKTLIEAARELETNSPEMQAFLQQVIQLAQAFQAEELEQLFGQFLP
ncbi:two-component system sensor histidine kinase/response regulator [Leptolyngbya sp. 'hensonii']|uniref:hybrid sensor histidine kinase/response regulator n=1 Tax=Leptolyngbya sp. 'hensonii' TaxID=1922337 RepID=UPI00094FAABB|nr:hybrid sensor histidine kinase/response regulator [Leptolyngbya sp. 'hensonii']OLP20226.1 two-component system sensor histidine kinase/response regulator [Leptolyngbya sp. 'hensonii']